MFWLFYRPTGLDSQTTITIEGQTFTVDADDLVAQCVLGQGAYGVVEKMCHTKTNTVMAVKVSRVHERGVDDIGWGGVY